MILGVVKWCLTLSPMVSLMYKAKCIHPRMNNSPTLWHVTDLIPHGQSHVSSEVYSSQSEQLPKFMVPKFMVVCYSVVWYCMLGLGMVWVLSIDGCSLQMGAKHPSAENTHLQKAPIPYHDQTYHTIPHYNIPMGWEHHFWGPCIKGFSKIQHMHGPYDI